MPHTPGTDLHPLLLDPAYWKERVARAAKVPLGLLVLPRPELESPGIEVFEFLLHTHDGGRLSALLARPEGAGVDQSCGLRVRPQHAPRRVLPKDFAAGYADLYYRAPRDRKLEERVLDTLRLLRAIRQFPWVAQEKLELPRPRGSGCQDEFLIAQSLIDRGF